MISPRAASFLRNYARQWANLNELAPLAEEYFLDRLRPGNFDLHNVTARVKSADSVRAKILARGYRDPYRQLTDQLGVRVITYFESDVDRVVDHLRPLLVVDEAKSADKRSSLGLREFGYSSVHLVATMRPIGLGLEFQRLDGVRVEVQVRSVLEHAWAEIEHEVVYKSGIAYPEEITRRFSSIAGALELLQREFEALRMRRSQLIEDYVTKFRNGQGLDEPLDAAKLLALLEVTRPGGLSWREAVRLGTPFPPRIEKVCVAALRGVGIRTCRSLKDYLGSRRFLRVASGFAALEAGNPEHLSHLAVTVLAISARNLDTAELYLPELAGNISVRSAVQESK